MFKFLRKYNKYILAVGGTLLLITFLIPFALTGLLQDIGQGGATWATVGREKREKVTVTDLSKLQRELQILQILAPQFQSIGALDRAEYWFLLVREADEAGLIGAPTVASVEVETQLGFVAQAAGVPMGEARETFAKAEGVARLIGLYTDSGKYSDRRLKHQARKMLHRVIVQPVVIEATRPSEAVSFSEGELLHQMETYADQTPGEGDMGFGYRLPHRLKLEWMVIGAVTVGEMIESGDQLNPVALRRHWRLGAKEGKFSQPEAGAAVPDVVRNDLLDELTRKALDRIARKANDKLRFDRRGLTQHGGYLQIPQDFNGLGFEKLALDLQIDNPGLALPEYHATGNRWLTAEDVALLPGIGTATTTKFGETPVPLADLVMAERDLRGSSTIPIQMAIAGPPMRGADGSVYLFRIIDTDPSRPPESIDEVRDDVIADLNRLAHFRELKAAAAAIRKAAIDDGLLGVAMSHDTAVENRLSVSTAFPSVFPKIGESTISSETIVDHALTLPPVAIWELPEQDRVLVLPVEDQLALLVVRLMAVQPLTKESFQTQVRFGYIQDRLATEEIAEVDTAQGEFSYEALAERHRFELSRDTTDPATTQPDDAQANAN